MRPIISICSATTAPTSDFGSGFRVWGRAADARRDLRCRATSSRLEGSSRTSSKVGSCFWLSSSLGRGAGLETTEVCVLQKQG